MPAQLPPASGYTYAVEFSVDEAMAAGATDVRFDQPVYQYVENFLNFRSARPCRRLLRPAERPPGCRPRTAGSSRSSASPARWPTSTPTATEPPTTTRRWASPTGSGPRLAELYTAGQGLWRVPIPHFTCVGLQPWDALQGRRLDPPKVEPPVATAGDEDPIHLPAGSVIECENQVLGETSASPAPPSPCTTGATAYPVTARRTRSTSR